MRWACYRTASSTSSLGDRREPAGLDSQRLGQTIEHVHVEGGHVGVLDAVDARTPNVGTLCQLGLSEGERLAE